MTTGKIIALTRCTFVGKVMSLLFHMLSRMIIAFLPRNKHILTSCLQSPSAVILKPKKIKSLFPLFTLLFAISDGTRCHGFSLLNFEFLVRFSLSSFTFIKSLFSSSSFSAIGWCHLHIWGYWFFSQQSWFRFVIHAAHNFTWCTLHIS